MPTIEVNGVELYYEVEGDGPPLVLVHGNWVDHLSWQAVVPLLAESFRVITYDRRGHSRSERPAGVVPRRENEEDLARIIDELGSGSAYVAGNSYGGLVSLGLAARRPELLRSVAVHEPPALGMVAGGELGRLAGGLTATVETIVGRIEAGHAEEGARQFVEEVALGPGAWEMLPEPMRATMTRNAPAFVAELDPAWTVVETEAVERFPRRILVTKGDASPRWLQLMADRLAELLPSAETATFGGAGHAPHLSHPAEYAELLSKFFGRAQLGLAA